MSEDRERFHCALCEAEFASSAELVRHERQNHTQQADGSSQNLDDDQAKPRQNREFTRRSME